MMVPIHKNNAPIPCESKSHRHIPINSLEFPDNLTRCTDQRGAFMNREY